MILDRWRRPAAAEVRSKLGEGQILAIDGSANFFGLESKGRWQIRGNGCLAATAHEILFRMWIPRREVTIPRDRIIAVEHARSHLGKTVFRPILRIRFTRADGHRDAAAWWVRDLAAWDAALAT